MKRLIFGLFILSIISCGDIKWKKDTEIDAIKDQTIAIKDQTEVIREQNKILQEISNQLKISKR